MFSKLLKHEWRATAPTLGILNLAVLGTSVLAALLLRSQELQYDGPFAVIIDIVMTFAIIAAVVCALAAEVVLLVRFYKSRFTDQGYLTFTLPVSSHQIFLSSALNMLIWTVISGIVVISSYILFCVIGIGDVLVDIYEEFDGILGQIAPEFNYTWAVIVQLVTAIPYGIVTSLTCITVGSVVAKKHKLLGAFASYYALNLIASTISTTLTNALHVSSMDYLLSSSFEQMCEIMVKQIMWITVPMQLVLTVGGYILSTQLMKKKLNLP